MFNDQQNEQKPKSWRTRLYILGTVAGAMMGFFSAYLFAQEAEDELEKEDEAPDIPATALLTLALSAIGLVRQIAETGSKKKSRKK